MALCAALVALGYVTDRGSLPAFRGAEQRVFPPAGVPAGGSSTPTPLLALTSLTTAALIGILITAVARRTRRDKSLPQSMEQAQVLLCVSGAMMMIVIGDSLVRAFGIAGAASIIRFRTPVDDPKDITILFLLMGLGMSTGLGAFAMAGVGTLFLCAVLLVLDRFGRARGRPYVVELTSLSREFPTAHVENLFLANGVQFEAREVSQGKETSVRYYCTLDSRASLEDIGSQLMTPEAGVASVSWDAKRS
jgi:hypothetical protein